MFSPLLTPSARSRPLVVGHLWGGHLALRIAAEQPQRLRGVLAVDPLGVVGDGGLAACQTELMARTPQQLRARARKSSTSAQRPAGPLPQR